LRLLGALADAAADHHRERQRRTWQDRAASAEQFERLVAALYAELDVPAVAYAAANEGRRWTDCDRVTIVRCEGSSARTLAVSGVDLVDRRSDQVRLLERLVAAVVRERDPLWHLDRSAEVESPAVGRALTDYVDQSDAASLVVLPLSESETDAGRPPFAALVLERFTADGATDDAWRDRVAALARHAGQALRRAVECDGVPLSRWWRRQYRSRGRLGHRWFRIGVVAATAALVAAVPFFIPAQAMVESRGTLEPQQRRDLFAPTDGVVAEVLVSHGKTVAVDDPLVVLRKPELTVDLTRVAGELQTAERRLAALRASRTFANPADMQARIQAQERTAEEEQLKETIRALGDEQKLLLEQVRDLTIRAPFAGAVTTWDVERVLVGRPVARGQALLGLADPTGPWVVELLIPERLVGDVPAAQRARADPLVVEFVAATNPATTYRGTLLRVAETAETDPELGVVVKATVAADRESIDPAQLRPGAAVTARIHCGASSVGAVWTRDLRHFLKSWWW
jgi:biotin carboxyl carrier protein